MTEKKYTTEELEQEFQKLPKDVQEAISSVDTGRIMQEVTKKHKLHLDQAAALGNEVTLLMLGLTHPGDFIPSVMRKSHLPKETATEITEELNARIFQKIRDSLKQIHHLANKETEEGVEEEPKPHPTLSKLPPEEEGVEEGKDGSTPSSDQERSESEEQTAKNEKYYPENTDPYREKIE